MVKKKVARNAHVYGLGWQVDPVTSKPRFLCVLEYRDDHERDVTVPHFYIQPYLLDRLRAEFVVLSICNFERDDLVYTRYLLVPASNTDEIEGECDEKGCLWWPAHVLQEILKELETRARKTMEAEFSLPDPEEEGGD